MAVLCNFGAEYLTGNGMLEAAEVGEGDGRALVRDVMGLCVCVCVVC